MNKGSNDKKHNITTFHNDRVKTTVDTETMKFPNKTETKNSTPSSYIDCSICHQHQPQIHNNSNDSTVASECMVHRGDTGDLLRVLSSGLWNWNLLQMPCQTRCVKLQRQNTMRFPSYRITCVTFKLRQCRRWITQKEMLEEEIRKHFEGRTKTQGNSPSQFLSIEEKVFLFKISMRLSGQVLWRHRYCVGAAMIHSIGKQLSFHMAKARHLHFLRCEITKRKWKREQKHIHYIHSDSFSILIFFSLFILFLLFTKKGEKHSVEREKEKTKRRVTSHLSGAATDPRFVRPPSWLAHLLRNALACGCNTEQTVFVAHCMWYHVHDMCFVSLARSKLQSGDAATPWTQIMCFWHFTKFTVFWCILSILLYSVNSVNLILFCASNA